MPGGDQDKKRPIRNFRDIVAWQRAKSLCSAVYALARALPDEERFALANQMRRAAVSVPANIAEGFGLGSKLSILKHLRIARGSLFELWTMIELAEDLHRAPPPKGALELIAETDRLLQAFIRSLRDSGRRPPTGTDPTP